jgi:hypothetical protein
VGNSFLAKSLQCSQSLFTLSGGGDPGEGGLGGGWLLGGLLWLMGTFGEAFCLDVSRGVGEGDCHSIEILAHDDLTSQSTRLR